MKNSIVKIVVIVIGLVIGFILYLYLVNLKKEIYAVSFDGEYKFILTKEKVKDFNFDSRSGSASFTVKDPEEFIKNRVLNHTNYLTTLHSSSLIQNKDNIIYVFLVDAYYFHLWVNPNNSFVLYSSYAEYDSIHGNLYFPFINNRVFNNDLNTLSWSNIKEIKNFEDVADYYRKSNVDYYIIDDDKEIIYVKCFNINNNRQESKGYPIKITFNDEELKVELNEDEL